MAEQKVWSNETGQVMLGAGGMILRQPFNFGNCFTNNTTTTTIHLVRQNDFGLISTFCSVVMWGEVTSGNIRIYHSNPAFRHITQTSNALLYIGSTPYGGVGGKLMAGVSISSQSSALRYSKNISGSSNVVTFTPTTLATLSPSDPIYIGRSVNVYLQEQKLAQIIYFNRNITREEFDFLFANGVGSEPMTSLGILVYLKFHKAEVLDFSPNNYLYDPLNIPGDSNFKVGVRDISGNNYHFEFVNLPAGTLTEKMDWANDNLFIPF